MPSRCLTSGRKFSTRTSAFAASRRSTSRPRGCFRSSVSARLFRWRFRKSNPSAVESPSISSRASTRTTCAPMSASCRTAVGPERARVRSTTRMWESGRGSGISPTISRLAILAPVRTPGTGGLLLRNGLVAGRRQDVAILDGRIHRIGPDLAGPGGETLDVADKLVLPGFVETHIHPDKAFIADRTEGLRAGGPSPLTLVAELKKRFTEDDIYRRASRVLELAVRHGCTTMRAHVEIDALVELRGLAALRRLQRELAGILDLRLIAFAQEGLFNDAVTQDLLRAALRSGVEALGGCPYMDRDQRAHIDWCFETAQAFGVPLDFHADTADDPAMLTSDYIAEQTIARGLEGRVTL